jgi:8-oxo-dGTP diphosphatase
MGENSECRHWGRRGAAGILPYAVVDGKVFVAMSLRSMHVHEGRTWSTFGGAIDQGEYAWQAADREVREEVRGLIYGPEGITFRYRERCPNGCGWSYTTFVVRTELDRAGRLPRIRAAHHSAWESDGFSWVPLEDVGTLRLHSGFARTWARNYKSIVDTETI